MLDFDDWFIEVWEPENPGIDPDMDDYRDYLFGVADLALGDL